MPGYDGPLVFEGVATTLERAIEVATMKIPTRPGRDFVTAHVVEFGMQYGGIALQKMFFAKVVEEPDSQFKPTSP